jgi:hypothetical protein
MILDLILSALVDTVGSNATMQKLGLLLVGALLVVVGIVTGVHHFVVAGGIMVIGSLIWVVYSIFKRGE